MSKIVKIWAFVALCVLVACEQQKVEEPVLPQEEPFTFTAVAGPDTRVSAEFGDTENIINFRWSEDDSLFVCFVETDSLTCIGTGVNGSDFNARWDTYVFKLKSGAGTSSAVFQSVGMNPSEVLKEGVNYTMNAVYHPGDENHPWGLWDHHVESNRSFQQNQTYDPDATLSNIAANTMMMAYPVEISLNSSPELRFAHGAALYRVRVRNTGLDPLVIHSLEVPGGLHRAGFYAYDFDNKYGPRYFGETRYALSMLSPVSIASGETKAFYISMMPSGVRNDDWNNDWTHIVNLAGNKSIRVSKNPTVGFELAPGRMYSTTLSIRSDMATDGGEIPPITGGDEDDI